MSRKSGSSSTLLRPQRHFEMIQTTETPKLYPRLEEIRNLRVHQRKQKLNRFSLLVVLIGVAVTVLFLYIICGTKGSANSLRRRDKPTIKNLLLTPMINAGNITEARELANVTLFPGIESYSGFLTVDDDCKSHLFFWFFPAASGNKSAPLLLWHGGGPGTSSLLALFQGSGPIVLDPEGKSWSYSTTTWTKDRSVLYLDSPVGSGFSFTEGGHLCYAYSTDDVADRAIEALRQFYLLFPQYQRNDLYISSSSYGGKFAPSIAWRIEDDNQIDHMNGNESSINLKGVISISGFSDPINQIDYGDFYYSMGIIDAAQLQYFRSQEALAKAYINAKNTFQAYQIIDPLIIGGSNGEPSYLKNITGIRHLGNFVSEFANPNIQTYLHRHEVFLNQKWVQESIHVDTSSIGREFKTASEVVYLNLVGDLYKSVSGHVETLLNKGCKFLFTSGQFDLIVPHPTIRKFLQELRWTGTLAYNESTTTLWGYKGLVTGYANIVENLTYIMFKNTGHHLFVDQPEWTLDMILRFTE